MLCTSCKKDLVEEAAICTGCGAPTKNYKTQLPSDDGMKYLIPTNVSPWAMAAGYLGIFSMIPIVAPFAIIIGIIALNQLKKHPEQSGKGRAVFGIVFPSLILLFIIILIIASSMAS